LTLAFAFVEMAVLIADILGRISQKENYSLLLEFALLLPVTLTFALGSCWFCREAGMTDERKAWSITAGLLALAPILVAGWILLGLNACSMLLAIADILVATFLFAIASFSTSVAAGRHQTELKENASAAPAEPFPGKDAS
jgi:hypothetical protein